MSIIEDPPPRTITPFVRRYHGPTFLEQARSEQAPKCFGHHYPTSPTCLEICHHATACKDTSPQKPAAPAEDHDGD